jgi:hypothetical protein
MQRGAIGVGKNGDRLDAEIATSTNHADRDLAAISNQDAVKHGASFAACHPDRNESASGAEVSSPSDYL